MNKKISELSDFTGSTSGLTFVVVEAGTTRKGEYDNIVSAITLNYVNTTGDTMTGQLNVPILSATSVDSHLIPATDGTYDLGSSGYTWRSLYLSGSTIYMKDTADTTTAISLTTDDLGNPTLAIAGEKMVKSSTGTSINNSTGTTVGTGTTKISISNSPDTIIGNGGENISIIQSETITIGENNRNISCGPCVYVAIGQKQSYKIAMSMTSGATIGSGTTGVTITQSEDITLGDNISNTTIDGCKSLSTSGSSQNPLWKWEKVRRLENTYDTTIGSDSGRIDFRVVSGATIGSGCTGVTLSQCEDVTIGNNSLYIEGRNTTRLTVQGHTDNRSSLVFGGTDVGINGVSGVIMLGLTNYTATTSATTYVNNLTSINDISGNTFYGDGSNLTGISSGLWSAGSGTDAIVLNNSGGDASGILAVSEGQSTTASANYTHAEGSETIASGLYSHAEGQSTIASGTRSHAEGYKATASGDYSHVEGGGSDKNPHLASGDYSHAEGFETTASANYSHTEGSSTRAFGDYSHAEGSDSIASGLRSHAEGYATTAIGNNSHSEGYLTIASGTSSHAEGYATTAVNGQSHAEGQSTTASGLQSHAEGLSCIASGNRAHAEGASTIAGGNYSHAEGNYTFASGENSHAEGYLTTTLAANSHVGGYLNVLTADATNSAMVAGSGMTGTATNTLYTSKIETMGVGEGVIMKSPDGTRYKLTIANGGTVSIVSV